jgi:hypothetical protein
MCLHGKWQNPERRYRIERCSAANERRQDASAERMCLHGKWLFFFVKSDTVKK